jgi:putative flippase GtrA
VGQGVRYAVAGSVVALWYLLMTTILAEVVGLAFQLALAIGFATSLLVHFTLQRFFVWVHRSEFALGIGAQVGRYLLVAAIQYALTAAATALLPPVLELPVTPVYLVTALGLAAGNFLIFRGGVFHPDANDARPHATAARPVSSPRDEAERSR